MSVLRSEAVGPRVHLALLSVQLMFGSLPVAGKLLYSFGHLEPLGLVAARTAGAAAAFWLVILIGGRREPIRRPAHMARFLVYALLGVAINQVLFLLGLDYTTAVNASVLITTIPIFTAALVLLLGQEIARLHRVLGIVIALAGAGAVCGIDRLDLSSRLLAGNLMIVANALSYSLFLVLSRSMLSLYTPLTVTAWVFLFGALFTVPVGALPLAEAVGRFGLAEWALLAWIVGVPTVGAYFLNSWSLKRAPASLVAVYVYLQPVTAAILAAALLGEIIDAKVGAGAVTIFAGIYLAAGRRRG
ncbi:MAG: DMT family transporter [Planctomycetes bacterium]|nr:DMT family transporter [Planctomycetota bacterium]